MGTLLQYIKCDQIHMQGSGRIVCSLFVLKTTVLIVFSNSFVQRTLGCISISCYFGSIAPYDFYVRFG